LATSRRFVLPVAALFLVAQPASSATKDTGPADTGSASRPVPKSIWQTDASGAATHLQSELRCPLNVGSVKRVAVLAFDAYGFDVDCNYLGSEGNEISLYLTRRGDGHALAADLVNAQREFTTVYPAATEMPDSPESDIKSDLTWLKKLYANPARSKTDGIWVADLGGWTLEYRVTFDADKAAAVADELAALTVLAESSAGMHLARCGKSEVPSRSAAVSRSDGSSLSLALAMGAMVGAASPDQFAPLHAADWCVEQGVVRDEIPILVWHGIDANGATMPIDRASIMTTGEPFALESAADPNLNQIAKELGAGSEPTFAVTHDDGTKMAIFGIYTGRPDADTLTGILDDIVHDRAKALGGVDRKTNTINVTPPDKKP
jgi:hypothetical protein